MILQLEKMNLRNQRLEDIKLDLENKMLLLTEDNRSLLETLTQHKDNDMKSTKKRHLKISKLKELQTIKDEKIENYQLKMNEMNKTQENLLKNS